MRDETTEIGAGADDAGTQPGTAEKVSTSEKEKVAPAPKSTAKKKKVLSEKQKAVIEANKFKKGNPLASSGGTMKARINRMLTALAEAAEKENLPEFTIKAAKNGKDKVAQACLNVLKQCGVDFVLTDEGKEQKINVKGEVEQKRNIVINFRKATPEDAK